MSEKFLAVKPSNINVEGYFNKMAVGQIFTFKVNLPDPTIAFTPSIIGSGATVHY